MELLSTNNGDLRKMVDKVVSWLHYLPCPNKKAVNKTIYEIIDIFWKDFKHFTYRTGPYSHRSSWFENDDALSGRSYLWYEMHFLLFVVCQTTSKRLGVGLAECSWSDVKTIKNGKRANIGGQTWRKGPFCTHPKSLRRLDYREIWILLMTLTMMCLVMII